MKTQCSKNNNYFFYLKNLSNNKFYYVQNSKVVLYVQYTVNHVSYCRSAFFKIAALALSTLYITYNFHVILYPMLMTFMVP
jgi:hypothetical protein